MRRLSSTGEEGGHHAGTQVSGVACFYSRRRLVFDSAFLRGLESAGRHLGELGLRIMLEKALELSPGRG